MTSEREFSISFNKLYDQRKAEIRGVFFAGEKMEAYFCQSEKGMRVLVGKWRKTAPYRSCGHWHSGRLFLDVYFSKWFRNKEEGNEYFKGVKSDKQVIRW